MKAPGLQGLRSGFGLFCEKETTGGEFRVLRALVVRTLFRV